MKTDIQTLEKPKHHTKSPVSEPSPAFEVTKEDAALYKRLVGNFVPPNAFDAHAHIYRVNQQGDTVIPFMAKGPPVFGVDLFRRLPTRWMGDRAPKDGLFFAPPRSSMDVDASNQFIQDEVSSLPGSRWLLLITPKDDPSEVEKAAQLSGCAGFKVYHLFALGLKNTFLADIGAYLPEWAWEIANRHSHAIMLHMVKNRALADPSNSRYIREHCIQYPNAKLILAHAARGFCGRHTVEGVRHIRGLDNVFFETSVACDSEPIEAILKAYGPSRLMYGSDSPFTEILGRSVSMGDRFFWLTKDNADYAEQKRSIDRPALLGIESILAIKQACQNLGLNDDDVEQIFCRTARELLGISSRAEQLIGQKLYEEAKKIIPGGAQLFGKRSENFAPQQWPAYFAEARGCETIDLDGRRYTDMSMCGIGATLLGYADPDVTAAVNRRIHLGSMCTLNPPEEVELAKLLIQIHPWAEMVRFARTGGETMAIAVRIARARTRRDKIAFCGYHGWQDWYLAANLSEGDALAGYHLLPGLEPTGVPRGLAGTMHPFNYNKLDELKAIVDRHGKELAAIVMEPTRHLEPAPGFLEGVRELADRCGACLIMDEVSIGWRLCLGGAHLKFGIEPDIAVLAKTLGGGHPISAVIGKGDTMQAAEETFISSAFWTEAVGPAAGVAAVKKMMRIDVPAHVKKIGQLARKGLQELAKTHCVPLKITGYPAMNYFSFDHPKALALQTLWTVRLLDRGFLASSAFYPTLAHEELHVRSYLAACNEVFAEMAQGIQKDDIEKRIGGPVKQAGFKRLA